MDGYLGSKDITCICLGSSDETYIFSDQTYLVFHFSVLDLNLE